MSRKKTGIRYLDVCYNVNPSKNVVVCHLTCGINLFRLPNVNVINDLYVFDDINARIETWEDENGNAAPYIVFEVNAFAYCSPEDEFNEEIGKKLALTRAQAHAFSIGTDFYEYIFRKIYDLLETYNRLWSNCSLSYVNCLTHSDDIINDIDNK